MGLVFLVQASCHLDQTNSNLKTTQKQEAIQGVWQSLGYGHVLSVKGGKKQLYDFTANHCYQQALSSREIDAMLTDLTWLDEQTISGHIEGGITSYKFKRIHRIPEHCTQAKGSHVLALQYFIELMETHYAYFDLYEVDWSQRSQQLQAGLHAGLSDQEAWELMLVSLEGIKDAHFYVAAEVSGAERLQQLGHSRTLRPALDLAFAGQNDTKDPRQFRRDWHARYKKHIETQVLQAGFDYAANDKLLWGRVGKLGYINLLRMMDLSRSGRLQEDVNTFKKHMDQIMTALQDTSALVIDVTTNSGGHDEIGLLMTGYFITQPTWVYSKYAHDAGLPPQQIEAVPQQRQYNKPVYVLTSDHTVSAAETFVMAMKKLPQVTHVGAATRGAFSDVLDKTLPNGWATGLSNEVYLDTNGKSWEGRGLQPDWQLPVFAGPDIEVSHVNALKTLLYELQSGG